MQKPIFTVMPNKLIETIAIKRPTTLNELSLLKGAGPKTLQKFGRKILDIVQKHSSDDDSSNLEVISEQNRISDSTFWAKYVKPKPKKAKKASPEDAVKAAEKRKRKIQMLSDSTLLEQKWPDIEFADLNAEQQEAATHILSGKNTFLTGSAGTGKTFLLRYVIQELERRYGDSRVAITAPTGIAAINIGGQTIHSFAGIGIGNIDIY